MSLKPTPDPVIAANSQRHSPAHVPPHPLNRIKLAMSLAISSAPIAESSEPDLKPGPHFAGLLRTESSDPLNSGRSPIASDGEKGADPEADFDSDESADEGQIESPRARWKKADARAIVAERLLAARLMNGYSQTEAAERMKYGTSAQLSQWEQCRRSPPLHMLLCASDVYGVSLDYLCGISPEPDRDVRVVRRNATERAVRATLVSVAERTIAAMNSAESVVGFNVATVRELVAAAEAVGATYSDFMRQRHVARFADRLAVAAESLENASLKAGIALRRHDDEGARAKQRLAEIAANDAG